MNEAPDERVLEVMRSRSGWFVIGLAYASGIPHDQLYPALARLEQTGQVTSSWWPGETPRRRYYQIAQEER